MQTGGVRQRRLATPDDGAGDSDPSGRDASEPTVSHTDGGFSLLLKICGFLLAVPIILLIAIDMAVDSPIDPESYTLPSPPKLEGPLAPNQALAATEKLFEGEISGPESITVQHGHLYTGTADGKILHIHDGKIRVVTRLGRPPCGGFQNEPHCGRPLGMRFDAEGYLIVADAYLGLFKVNVSTGESELLFPSSSQIAGKKPKFFNDLDIASDGTIYLTDSSTRFDRRSHPLSFVEGRPNGRLLKFDPATREMTVIKDKLCFANGVQLSTNEDYLLIAESTRSRILKYTLTGPEKGSTETFIENLPGFPDNVRASSSGGFWVGLASHRDSDTFSLMDTLSTWPAARRLIVKILSPQTIYKMAFKSYGLVLELDTRGHIVRSLHDPKGRTIAGVSEVEDVAGHLYFGSFRESFIGKLDLRQQSSGK